MNVPNALLVVMLFGAFAGLMHGIIVYGGLLLPQRLKDKKVPQDDGNPLVFSMYVPGAFGHAAIGATAGLGVFCSLHRDLVLGWSAQYTPTLGDVLFAVGLGLAGSAGLNIWLDRQDLLGVRVQPVPGGDGKNPPVADDSKNNATVSSQTRKAIKPLQKAGVEVEVIETPKWGVCTNHSYRVYKALPSF